LPNGRQPIRQEYEAAARNSSSPQTLKSAAMRQSLNKLHRLAAMGFHQLAFPHDTAAAEWASAYSPRI